LFGAENNRNPCDSKIHKAITDEKLFPEKEIVQSNTMMHRILERIKKGILIIVGTFFVGLGMVGIFLPLLPTTPFLLLAAMCYVRSSKRFYIWLLNNNLFGKYIKNYREGKGVPLKAKVLSISLLWITILTSVIFGSQNIIVRIVLISIAIGVTIHLLILRTYTQHKEE
jgi:uncharacterized membrane protein YbaN (DUF454 family)